MNFLHKIKIPGFNKRSLSEVDAHWICEEEKITVIEAFVPTSFYFVCKGKAFIVLNKKLRGLKKLFEFWHEIGHHFLHSGREYESYFFGLIECKNEIEADAFATVALVPRYMLNSYDFLEEHPNRYARQLFKNRQKLDFLYQI